MTLAEPPSLSSPAKVAAAFFAALQDARWYDAVALVDEKVLAEFHAREVASLLSKAELRAEFRRMRDGGRGGVGYSPDPATNAVLLETYSEMPVLGIEGVHTIGNYAALSPAELLARHLEAGNGPVYHFAPSLLARFKKEAESRPDSQLPEAFPKRIGARNRRIVGSVVERLGPDEIAHVVYRHERGEEGGVEVRDDRHPFGVEILHLWNRSGWRVALGVHDHHLFGPPWFELDYDWEPSSGSAQAG
jgi:hypothetical protein